MTPPDQLPAIITPAALPTPAPADTYIVPALIADLGDQAGWRYVEFFTANIRNPHTRRAYARAAKEFLAWCADAGVPSIPAVQPVHVATWIEAYRVWGRDERRPGWAELWDRVGDRYLVAKQRWFEQHRDELEAYLR